MEQSNDIKELIRGILEPIIDDCITRAMNKYINEIRYDQPIDSEVLGVPEAISYLKIAKPTMYSLTQKREIPFYKKGKRIYFRKEDLDNWINKGKIKTKEEIIEELDSSANRRFRR